MSRELTREEFLIRLATLCTMKESERPIVKLLPLRDELMAHDAIQRQQLANRCEHCGATVNMNGCLVCGAPQCCPQCCQVDALTARIAELEQALRLHLAVSPDDPLLLTPVEQQIVMLTAKVAEVERERDKLRAVKISLKAACDSAGMMIDSRDARVKALEEQVTLFATHIKGQIPVGWMGENPDATERAAVDWLAALSQDGVKGKE